MKKTNNTTTLYKLFNTVFDAAGTENEDLVSSVVMHIIDTGKIKLVCKDEKCSNFTV